MELAVGQGRIPGAGAGGSRKLVTPPLIPLTDPRNIARNSVIGADSVAGETGIEGEHLVGPRPGEVGAAVDHERPELDDLGHDARPELLADPVAVPDEVIDILQHAEDAPVQQAGHSHVPDDHLELRARDPGPDEGEEAEEAVEEGPVAPRRQPDFAPLAVHPHPQALDQRGPRDDLVRVQAGVIEHLGDREPVGVDNVGGGRDVVGVVRVDHDHPRRPSHRRRGRRSKRNGTSGRACLQIVLWASWAKWKAQENPMGITPKHGKMKS